VAAKWVQMAAAEQGKGKKVQEMRGKWMVFVKKWGNLLTGGQKRRADESDFCESCVREKICRKMDGNGEKVGQSGGVVGANGGSRAGKGQKSAGNVRKVGGVRQKVGK